MILYIEPTYGGIYGKYSQTHVKVKTLTPNNTTIPKQKTLSIKGYDSEGNVFKEIILTVQQDAADDTYMGITSDLPIYVDSSGALEDEIAIFGKSNLHYINITQEDITGISVLPIEPFVLCSKTNYGYTSKAWFDALDLQGNLSDEETVYKYMSGEPLPEDFIYDGHYYFCIPMGKIPRNDTNNIRSFHIRLLHNQLEEDMPESNETWCEIRQSTNSYE